MAWYMPEAIFGNSKEPLLKIMENGLSSVFTPVVDFFKAGFNFLYSNYPNLTLVGGAFVGVLGYLGFNRFRTKKAAERVSEKEKHLDKIPAMKRAIDDSSTSQSEGFKQQASAMLNVTTAAGQNSNVVLGLSNALGAIGEKLSSLMGSSETHGRMLGNISRGTDMANSKLDGFAGYGKKLDTIEGLQRSANATLGEMDAVVRPRSNTTK